MKFSRLSAACRSGRRFYCTAGDLHTANGKTTTDILSGTATNPGLKAIATDAVSSQPVPVRLFNDIPGPSGWFGFLRYLPIIGKYSWLELHKAGRDKYLKYGSIVRETMVPGVDIVWLYDPNDIAVLLNQRNYPERRSHLALEKYRLDRPHVYRSAGLLPTNGPEWWRLRCEFQKGISAPKSVRSFLDDVDEVTQEFITLLPVDQPFDVLRVLQRLNLELTCLLTFGVRLQAFSRSESCRQSRSSRLMEAAETTNSCILPTDQGLQLWRHFQTPTYRRLRMAQEFMESVAVDLIKQRAQLRRNGTATAEDSGRSSLIEEYMKNPNLNESDVVGVAADFLLAGIDTTSYTSAFIFYHLARNPHVQQKLHEESRRVLEFKGSSLTADVLRTEIPYTRAVLKEVLRLNPVSIGVGRVLTQDAVFSGYQVPKGTVVVTQNMIACRLAKHFSDPMSFQPERWLNRKNSLNPYLVLPFGHGMRSCIARRMAEQNMLILILRLMRSFEISWKGCPEEVDVDTLLINKPSKPIRIHLKEK